MPNYVRTRLHFSGDLNAAKELRELVKSHYEKENFNGEKVLDSSGNVIICTNEFDFNKVIPTPEELNIPSSSSGDWGMRYLLLNAKHSILWTEDDRTFMERMEKQKEDNPERFNEDIELGKKYLNNISKYGHKDWYSFHIDYWGTKWSACEPVWDDDENVWFETAWSFAAPIVEKLSEMFPTLTIEFEFADEDAGSNTGSGEIKNGEYLRENYPDCGSNDAYAIYKEMWNYDNLVYNEETDSYEWSDFDEDE